MRCRKANIQSLRIKVAKEYRRFRKKVLLMKKEDIFSRAYEIDYKTRIYLILIEKCDEELFSMSEICYLCNSLNALEELYQEWLSVDDSSEEELESSLGKMIRYNIKEGA